MDKHCSACVCTAASVSKLEGNAYVLTWLLHLRLRPQRRAKGMTIILTICRLYVTCWSMHLFVLRVQNANVACFSFHNYIVRCSVLPINYVGGVCIACHRCLRPVSCRMRTMRQHVTAAGVRQLTFVHLFRSSKVFRLASAGHGMFMQCSVKHL